MKKLKLSWLRKRGTCGLSYYPLAHEDIHGEFGAIECLNS